MTGHVCYPCAKLIANSGIERVVVQPEGDAAWRNPEMSYEFMERCGLVVVVRDPR